MNKSSGEPIVDHDLTSSQLETLMALRRNRLRVIGFNFWSLLCSGALVVLLAIYIFLLAGELKSLFDMENQSKQFLYIYEDNRTRLSAWQKTVVDLRNAYEYSCYSNDRNRFLYCTFDCYRWGVRYFVDRRHALCGVELMQNNARASLYSRKFIFSRLRRTELGFIQYRKIKVKLGWGKIIGGLIFPTEMDENLPLKCRQSDTFFYLKVGVEKHEIVKYNQSFNLFLGDVSDLVVYNIYLSYRKLKKHKGINTTKTVDADNLKKPCTIPINERILNRSIISINSRNIGVQMSVNHSLPTMKKLND
ncbi:hypothetical protein ACOME3_005159 [Neoechinorhynchus agilis]